MPRGPGVTRPQPRNRLVPEAVRRGRAGARPCPERLARGVEPESTDARGPGDAVVGPASPARRAAPG